MCACVLSVASIFVTLLVLRIKFVALSAAANRKLTNSTNTILILMEHIEPAGALFLGRSFVVVGFYFHILHFVTICGMQHVFVCNWECLSANFCRFISMDVFFAAVFGFRCNNSYAAFHVLTFNLNFTCKNLSASCFQTNLPVDPSISYHHPVTAPSLLHALQQPLYRCNTNQCAFSCEYVSLYVRCLPSSQTLKPYNRQSFTLNFLFIRHKKLLPLYVAYPASTT